MGCGLWFCAICVCTLGLRPATFNKLVNSLSCFFAFLAAEGRIRVNVALESEQGVGCSRTRQLDQLTRVVERRSVVAG